MKKILKLLFGRPFYLYLIRLKHEFIFRRQLSLSKGKNIKMVIGSSQSYENGWVASEESFLNLLKESNFKKYFNDDNISNIMAEHVWEHLTVEEGKLAAKNCYKFLKKNGVLRVAVPDGFHDDENYIDLVKPGGKGNGADDHKVLYNYKTFSSIFSEAGFKIDLLEYFDENKKFHAKNWDKTGGLITRSIRYDRRNINAKPVYTSLILDAIKE